MTALAGKRGGGMGARIAYGAVFALVIPLLGVAWAAATEDVVGLPAVRAPLAGTALLAVGLAGMAVAMRALWVRGGGLPMNAFPPPARVTDGIYRLIRHPIYVGFTLAGAGLALLVGSASGLWLVTPVLTLGWLALVWGFENRDLEARLGPPHPTVIALPPEEPRRATATERLGYLVVAVGSWCALYGVVVAIGPPRDGVSLALPGEAGWPVWPWTEAVYATTYAVVLLSALILPRARDLRRLGKDALLASAISFPLYLLLPFVAAPRPFVPSSALGRLLALERGIDTSAGAFPSSHVWWAWLVAGAIGRAHPRLRLPARAWALAVAVACVTTGMHTVADVLAGFGVALLVPRLSVVWEGLRGAAERIANGFRTWRLGRVRVLSYAGFGFAAAAIGMAVVSALAGPSATAALVVAGLLSIVGAGVWAQIVERGAQLSRPYGFYGGLIGFIAGALLAPLTGADTAVVLAALATGGPLIQGVGRLRCLQQGCCHGAPTSERLGIRYRHPLSRVVKMTDWRDVPLQPTPLYSLLWSLLISAVLFRLWTLGAALGLIAGLFLILNGLGRFVEEGFRGEPQTRIIGGLRLYQYCAVATVMAGALVTALASRRPAPPPAPSAGGLLAVLALSVLVALASGVDFPASKRRFSRLA